MTDAALGKLCEKKLHEACGKLPKEKKRVLAAMLSAVMEKIRDQNQLEENTANLLSKMDDLGMKLPAVLRDVEFRG